MATDLDLQVDESVPANVTQPGATTVSAHTLFDIVRKLPEGSQVELTAAEGKRDEALYTLGKLVAATESEDGTLQYLMHTEVAEPDVIWFYERYADQAAFEAHATSTTMADVMGALAGLLDGPADMRQLDLVQRKGEPA